MIWEYLIDEVLRIKNEAEYCLSTIVLPNWWSKNLHGFPDILYGFIMSIMSRIDLVSSYYEWTNADQTKRMIRFLNKYFENENELNSVLIYMWRHQLMHTASPKSIINSTSWTRYEWLLHWWIEHLPIEQHYTFNETGGYKIIQIALIPLIEQLNMAIQKYLADLNWSSELHGKYENFRKKYEIRK